MKSLNSLAKKNYCIIKIEEHLQFYLIIEIS